MALFDRRSDEEKTAEAEAQARADWEDSPVGRAAAAFARGDEFYQVDLSVSALSTRQAFPLGAKVTKLRPSEVEPGDVLGQIEAMGWRLEHAGWVFVEVANRQASTSTSVNKGALKGVYLFRRSSSVR